MDFTFLLVTLILIIFLFISYLLRVIKLSTPLLLIYLIFCFTYIIDNETSKDTIIINDDMNDIQNIKGKKLVEFKKDIENNNEIIKLREDVVNFSKDLYFPNDLLE